MRVLHAALAAAIIAGLGASAAQAAAIIKPVSVSLASGGTLGPGTPGSFWHADYVIDQSGLSIGYTPGVTDFDAYLALAPKHSGALSTEWFTTESARSGRLIFDFGREVTLSKLAIWDENNSVQNSMSISTPALGLVRTFAPTESPNPNYLASAFDFGPITTRYLTLDITGCGQKMDIQSVPYCGLGEIIFAEGDIAAVPEPATWAMMILGFGGIGVTLRRRRALALA